jgi:hypothetical protein
LSPIFIFGALGATVGSASEKHPLKEILKKSIKTK